MILRQILVFCFPGIGDALMTTPLIRLLKNHHPEAHIDVVYMLPGVATVLKDNPNIRSLVYLPLYEGKNLVSALKTLISLRNCKYDLSILPYPAFRREYHLVNYFVRARERITHRYQSGYYKEFHFLSTYLIPIYEHKHNIQNNIRLLDPTLINLAKSQSSLNSQSEYYDFSLDDKSVQFGANYFTDQLKWDPIQTLAIHPGSTFSPTALFKRWPIQNYINITKTLLLDNKNVLFFLGKDEADLQAVLQENIKSDKFKIIQNIGLEKSLGILSQCRALLANDNGFAHIGAALKIPTVVLFGPTPATWTAPVSQGFIKIIEAPNFKPWFRYELKRKPPPKTGHGMALISVEDVLIHTKNALNV